MINKMTEYFNYTQQYYRFVVLKKIDELGSVYVPIELDDHEFIDAISKVHINNLLKDGFLESKNESLSLTPQGKAALNKHYIDYQINLMNLSNNLGDFYAEKINRLTGEVKGSAALYGASDTSKSIFNYVQNAGINLECVIDDNPKKQNEKYLELPVISMDALDQFNVETIIISSIEFQDKIKEKTVKKFGDKYMIITLFD